MRALAALLALLWAVPALATQDRWPALFDVTGVAADDVLNIRAAPDAGAGIVGTLAPDAAGIEVIRPDDRETWGLVNTGEGTGWVSLRFLARRPGQFFGAVPDRARCLGTEPFWSLDIADGTLEFSAMDDPSATGRVDAVHPSANRLGRAALSLRLTDPSGATRRDGVGFLSTESCSDGMSDRAYGYRIDLVLGDRSGVAAYSGCCSLVAD